MIAFRPHLWLSVFTTGAFVWLCWLGVWQMDRLAWKLELIEVSQTRSVGAAALLSETLDRPSLELMRYQKVTMTGTFDHDSEVYLYAPHTLGSGFRVITPLVSGSGTVLVDRGWVPAENRDPATRSSGRSVGQVTVEGLVILGGTATLGVSGHNDGVWMYRDLDGMAEYMGLEAVAPVFVAVLPSDNQPPWPKAEAPDLTFRNSHLAYAVTWFGLAFALVSVYIAFHISQGRLAIRRRK